MRDMCLRKCEEVGFLNYLGCRESDIASTAISVEIKKLRRCALNVETGVFVDKLNEHGERAAGLRSLLVFQDQNWSRKVWKYFPLLRVVDLEGSGVRYVDGVGHLLHLRYLSLRKLDFKELPSCFYDLRNLETLDLRCYGPWGCMLLCNKFDRMKKLKHLYLPSYFKVEGGEKLKFPNGGQMETIKNFIPDRCETTALMQMTNLRVFSITKWYTFDEREEVKAVLEAPVMKNEGQLINSFRLQLNGDVILKEEPGILSSATRHPCLTRLYLWSDEIGKDVWSDLKKLPHLKYLDVYGALGNKLSLSGGSFPRLTELNLRGQTELEELEVREGAFPNLEYLEITRCCKLEKWVVGKGAFPNLQTLMLKECRKLKLSNLPGSLSHVTLSECEIGEGPGSLLLALDRLPRLKYLTLEKPAAANRLSLSPRSLSQLTQLCLRRLEGVEELAIGDGAFPNLQYLQLEQCKELNKLENLPNSLTQVMLNSCGNGDSLLAELEKLPCLQELSIWDLIIATTGGGGNKLSFSPGSFPQLTQLQINSAQELEEWEVGDGALPHLQHLELLGCTKLKKIPSGLPPSVHIECRSPCIQGIENYNTCRDYNRMTPAAANRFKLMSCFR